MNVVPKPLKDGGIFFEEVEKWMDLFTVIQKFLCFPCIFQNHSLTDCRDRLPFSRTPVFFNMTFDILWKYLDSLFSPRVH